MAVENKKLRGGKIRYRAYWNNPFTRKREHGAWTSQKKAERESDEALFRLKHERESFRPAGQQMQPKGAMLLDLLAQYHACATMTQSTYESTFYHLKAAKAHAPFHEVAVCELSADHLKAYERELREKGLKQNGINRKVGIITAALSWAHEERIIKSIPINPAEYRCKRGKDKRTPPPTPQEVEELYSAASDHIRRAIFIAYLTGARVGPSELLSIRWSDFHFKERFIRIRSAQKNDDIQWRDIPVEDDAAWKMIKQWYKEDRSKGLRHVITWRGEPIKTIKRAWRATFARVNKARDKAKLPHIDYCKPYAIRHAFVTNMLGHGADLKTTSQMAGHSDIGTTTKIYQHEVEGLRKEAARKLPKLNVPGADSARDMKRDMKRDISTGFSCPANKTVQ